jgi:uncharacterized protein (TIGR03382 family)
MFTGLIAEIGTVDSIERTDSGARLRIAADLGRALGPGDSVAVSGACLTAVDPGPGGFAADVMNQTLGAHQLTIKATDSTTLTVTTQVINVTVTNAPSGGGDPNNPNNPGDPNGDGSTDISGGCNTSGGSAGALLGLALLGLVIRRRR